MSLFRDTLELNIEHKLLLQKKIGNSIIQRHTMHLVPLMNGTANKALTTASHYLISRIIFTSHSEIVFQGQYLGCIKDFTYQIIQLTTIQI